jgi:hypothetical protein
VRECLCIDRRGRESDGERGGRNKYIVERREKSLIKRERKISREGERERERYQERVQVCVSVLEREDRFIKGIMFHCKWAQSLH